MYFDASVVGLARVFRCCLLVFSCVCKGLPCSERDLWRAVRVCLPKVLAAILFLKKKQEQALWQSAPSRTSCHSRFLLCLKRLICPRRFLTSLAAVKRTLFSL